VRSLPAMCAETVWPLGVPSLLSSSTLNTVLGKSSRTMPSTSVTSSLDKLIASLKGSHSAGMGRVVGGDGLAEQLIALQQLVCQNGGCGGHMLSFLALGGRQGPPGAVGQQQHLSLHRHDGKGPGFVSPCLGAHQTAFCKV